MHATLNAMYHRFNGVVVITLASHARGRGFDPRRNLGVFCSECEILCTLHCSSTTMPKRSQGRVGATI